VADARTAGPRVAEQPATYADEVNLEEYVKILEKEMAEAAGSLDFERAALLRDQLFELRAAGTR
jgi:excinuclease ABC subunit B